MLGLAVAVVAILLAFAGRYGYHRDELYFRTAGRHLAWGYPDQPPLVPFLARILTEINPDSLVLFRLPSALVAGAIVVVTGLIARELGSERAAQVLAAGSMGIASLLFGASHLLSTTTFDLLGWAVVTWVFVRILQTGRLSLWVLAGVLAGVTLLANSLMAFLVAAFLGGIVISGPRRTFASPWPWVGGLIAAALWAPYVVWQARHGWPQLTVANNIAHGGSGSSAPRWLMMPEQFGLVSPWLAPVWIAGLVRLFRDAWLRAFGWAYVLLVLMFTVTGGKPYYLGGMFPLLLAAGAQPTVDWVRRGSQRLRRSALAAAFVLSAPAFAVTLPILPLSQLDTIPIADVNYDAGETVGWPAYVEQIATVYRRLTAEQRATTAIVTSNYGEAGAVDRYGGRLGLPHAYSGHNGYWYWGPPVANTRTVVAVGFGQAFLERFFDDVQLGARLDNRYDIDNDERGELVFTCTGPNADWSVLWDRFKDIG
ncbi:MAG: hypothetical protein QOG53_427 [Frankiales bacterium]|nr:hypothetical protein [Frankiales bacterium]